MVHLHGPVLVNMHQRPGLVVHRQREGDPKHHRGHPDPPLVHGVFGIRGHQFPPPLLHFRVLLQLPPDSLDPVVLHHLPVMGGHALARTAVEIPLPHGLRGQLQRPGDSVHDLLDHQHPLWPAETTKGGVGDQIRLRHPPADLHVLDEVAVVGVEHGPVGHGGGKIQRPASVREQLQLHRL